MDRRFVVGDRWVPGVRHHVAVLGARSDCGGHQQEDAVNNVLSMIWNETVLRPARDSACSFVTLHDLTGECLDMYNVVDPNPRTTPTHAKRGKDSKLRSSRMMTLVYDVAADPGAFSKSAGLLRVHLHLVAADLLDGFKGGLAGIELFRLGVLPVEFLGHLKGLVSTESFAHIDHPASKGDLRLDEWYCTYVGTYWVDSLALAKAFPELLTPHG